MKDILHGIYRLAELAGCMGKWYVATQGDII